MGHCAGEQGRELQHYHPHAPAPTSALAAPAALSHVLNCACVLMLPPSCLNPFPSTRG